LKVALASPPAIAAGRYVTAVRAGDLNGFLSTMTATASADYRGRGGTALFQQLRAGMPRDSRVASLVPQTDGSVLVSVEGHAGGVVVAYELTMVLVGLDWKVGP
jgi:hypothetical protein